MRLPVAMGMFSLYVNIKASPLDKGPYGRNSQGPHLRITEDDLRLSAKGISHNANLAVTVRAITDAINLLFIHIEIKHTPVCHDGNRVGLVQPFVNQRTGMG